MTRSRRARRLHHRRGAVDPRRARDARDRSSRSTSSMPRPRFTVHDERLQAEALARAAIELSVYQDHRDPHAAPTRGSFAFRLGNANVAARFRCRRPRASTSTPRPRNCCPACSPGSARRARPRTPTPTASSPGARRPAPARRTRSRPPIAPPGCSIRRAARRSSTSRNSGSCSGIPEALVERAMPFVTVYSASRRSTLDAAPQVLAALPGMDPGRLTRS